MNNTPKESDSYPRVEAQTKYYADGELDCRVQWVLDNANYGYVEVTKFGDHHAYVEKLTRGTRDATEAFYQRACLIRSSTFDVADR